MSIILPKNTLSSAATVTVFIHNAESWWHHCLEKRLAKYKQWLREKGGPDA